MNNSTNYYRNRILFGTDELTQLKKRIHLYGTLRLIIFCGGIAVTWLCRGAGWPAMIAVATFSGAYFAALVAIHSRLFARKLYIEKMIELCTGEMQGMDCDFEAFDGAPEEADSQHDFSADMDIFGAHSLFQSINRTCTHAGKRLLIKWLKHPLDTKAAILKRQEAIREMCRISRFRLHFIITGMVDKDSRDDILKCSALFDGTSSRLSQSLLWRIIVWTVPLAWLAILTAIICGILPAGAGGIMFAVIFLIAYLPGKYIHRLHRRAEKIENILKTYSCLIKQVEDEPFVSEELLNMQHNLVTHTGAASRHIRRLSAIIGALDQRFSFAGIILNIIYLRDVRQAMRLEAWTEAYAKDALRWFDALAHIDALCSLGTFAFNHPEYTYPTINDAGFRIEGKALGHPLIHHDKCIRNDVSIPRRPFLLIITGANMAGKSTYLRTVGVNFLLACMGLPVFADTLTISPAHLMTSLRTTDSLAANESSFFAELKRLKKIIDHLRMGDELFIVLDEILKGTNSEDRQRGSLNLMNQLIALNSCGIIATHDLMLGTMEKTFPEHIHNCCFEADIDDDRLTFDYSLRHGIAQNMNASFLMKKMGITL
ncbi:MAG: DNA mismatch repair protein MutS [Tannerella sp.]|jgi:hypothetical protein|nr:DNA mismatch repair protein MutS [Tannerella sp.]